MFWGTPAMAVPFLQRLAERTDVVAVITNPDQPAGRGYALQKSPVKQCAEELRLPVWQPERLSDGAFRERVASLNADLAVVVAYGKLIPPGILSIPRHGFLNVHFSLLPAYRGAAPIQWTLMNGETQTGVSLFWLDEGMDTGPLFLQRSIAIAPTDDGDS